MFKGVTIMQVNNVMLQDYVQEHTHSILVLKKLPYSLAGTAVLWNHLVIQRDGRKTQALHKSTWLRTS